MEWLQDFHFLRPYWLLALILPFIFGYRWLKNDAVQSSWAEVCDEHLLDFLLIKGHNKQRKFPYLLLSIIIFFTVIALSGPTWVKKENPALSVDNPVMIMINMSTDMWAKDVSPSRIVRAEYVVKDMLKSFNSTESGLLVYSREPFVISPLTEDTSLIENLLSQLDEDVLPENGDRLDRAIDLAVERMQKSGYESGNLIVLTADVGERFDAALESAAKAGTDGFDVNIIKISADKNDKLEMIADKGHGIYLDYTQNFLPLIDKINNIYAKELKQSENMQTVWEDMGYYLFWLPALLLLYYFRKGVLIANIVMLLGISSAEAGWFLNNNQEAARAFEKQNYAEAAKKFDIDTWKAAALYKDGKYEEALGEFGKRSDNTALYNQGNALAKSGKIAEAIKKYEQVLQEDANFEDARFNLEYLKKMQQQQQNQQNKQDSEQDKQQEKQQSSAEQNQEQQEQKEKQEDKSQDQQNQQSQSDKQQNQNAEQSKQPQEGEDKNKQKQDTEQQDGEQQQNPDGNGNGSDDKDKDMKQQQNQSKAEDKQDENAQNEAQAEKQSMYGDEDEQAEQEAQALQTQAGAKSDEQKEKIKARLQKFRDVPEDKGGLLRALIRKEYQLNRYKDK